MVVSWGENRYWLKLPHGDEWFFAEFKWLATADRLHLNAAEVPEENEAIGNAVVVVVVAVAEIAEEIGKLQLLVTFLETLKII